MAETLYFKLPPLPHGSPQARALGRAGSASASRTQAWPSPEALESDTPFSPNFILFPPIHREGASVLSGLGEILLSLTQIELVCFDKDGQVQALPLQGDCNAKKINRHYFEQKSIFLGEWG